MPLDDALLVLLLVSRPKQLEKVYIKSISIIDDPDGADFNCTYPRLPPVCSVVPFMSKPTATAPTLTQVLAKQTKNTFCQAVARDGTPCSNFSYDDNGILRTTPFDGTIQVLVPTSLHTSILHSSRYPRLTGHPKEWRIHDGMCWQFYRQRMSNGVYATVLYGQVCAMKPSMSEPKTLLKTFPQVPLCNFIATDILGPLRKTKTSSQFVVLLTHWYFKLRRVILSSKTTVSHVVSMFNDQWILFSEFPPTCSRTAVRKSLAKSSKRSASSWALTTQRVIRWYTTKRNSTTRASSHDCAISLLSTSETGNFLKSRWPIRTTQKSIGQHGPRHSVWFSHATHTNPPHSPHWRLCQLMQPRKSRLKLFDNRSYLASQIRIIMLTGEINPPNVDTSGTTTQPCNNDLRFAPTNLFLSTEFWHLLLTRWLTSRTQSSFLLI